MLSDFQFDLPPELIAQMPAERRDQARLLVLDRQDGRLTHTYVHALPDHLQPGDLLVVNDTRVIPARIFGRTASGGAVELLLIRAVTSTTFERADLYQHPDDFFPPLKKGGQGGFVRPREYDARLEGPHDAAGGQKSPLAPLFQRGESRATQRQIEIRPQWLCLGKPARRLRAGTEIHLPDNLRATVAAVHGDGRYSVAFEDAADVRALLERHGEIPLPPYIRRPDGPLPVDQTRYQSIFASAPGAVAAPTAGLHFTDELVAALRADGIEIARLTLHVGPGTFLPLRAEEVRQHVMEPEWCEIPAETAATIRRIKADGGRIIAVGTTTTRALESAAASDERSVRPGARWADRFIVPGYQFRVIDALFTNFHLPGSTLLLLVSAFAGRDRILAAYAESISHRYRFYSYGDAMLIQ